MFDVDISSTENYLNVPSLHNVALPPAYSAGARVSLVHVYVHAYGPGVVSLDMYLGAIYFIE